MNRIENITGVTTDRVTSRLTWFTASLLAAFVTGCGGGGGGGSGSILGADAITVGGSSTVAPIVSAVTPLNNATNVLLNRAASATFSKAMDPATITTANFTVACPVGTPITGTVAYVASSKIATFSHAANFPGSILCTATIATGAKDTTGIALANPYVWAFTTGLTADTTAPKIISTGANDGDIDLPINRNSTAIFNEPMSPATLASPATSFTVKEFLTGTLVAGVVTYTGNTVSFNPDSDLKPNFKYTSTITTTATDLAGNALVAGLKANPWSWTTAATGDLIVPTVTLVNPLDLAANICINKTINATFSEAMDQTTISTATFILAQTATLGTPVIGVVAYDPLTNIASFNPDANLAATTNYTATIKGGVSGAHDLANNALAADKIWTFDTGTTLCLAAINLGAVSTFGIAAHAGITNTTTVPVTHIEGDVVLDPLAQCNAVDVDAAGGFGLCGSNGSTPTITGTVISHFYDPANTRGTVIADLNAAFLSITPPAGPPAAGSLGSPTDLPAGTTLGAPTGSALVQGDNYFTPGLYQSITSIMVTGDLTLDAQGDANAVFVFQSSSTVGTAAGAAPPGVRTRIILTGGAKASNVWWQAASDATLGLYSEFQGNILAARDITMLTGATSCGRLMAGAWVGAGVGTGKFVFDSNVISTPGQPFAPPATYSTTCQ